MIDEVRLVIANRFGVHDRSPCGDPDPCQQRKSLQRSRRQLAGRARAVMAADPVLQLRPLRWVCAAAWQAGYAELLAQLNVSDWRTDIKYLHSEIDPICGVWRAAGNPAHRAADAGTAAGRRTGRYQPASRLVLFGSLALLLFLGVAWHLSFDRLILRAIRNPRRQLMYTSHDPLRVLPSTLW